jgi:hypothetical protein
MADRGKPFWTPGNDVPENCETKRTDYFRGDLPMELIARLSLPNFIHSIVIACIEIAPGCGSVRPSGRVLLPLDIRLHRTHPAGLCCPVPVQRRVQRADEDGWQSYSDEHMAQRLLHPVNQQIRNIMAPDLGLPSQRKLGNARSVETTATRRSMLRQESREYTTVISIRDAHTSMR